MSPSISVTKVSGSGAKNNIPMVRSYEKAGKAKSRRLLLCAESRKKHTPTGAEAQSGLVSGG